LGTGEAVSSTASPVPASDAMRHDEILACSIDRWYGEFKDVTFTSKIITLPEDFVKFLLSDGLRLPAGTGNFAGAGDIAEGADSDSEWGDGGSDSEEEPRFPELEVEVAAAIKRLDGSVLPKLNWSAPKDARWLTGSLCCESVSEVIMILKASDFVAHDLAHAFDHCADPALRRPDQYVLALRKWKSVSEAAEFRCFVGGGRLLAVSQRHTSLFFPDLSNENHTDGVMEALQEFFVERVRGGFPLSRYVFDVVVGKAPRWKVTLVDFSPWGASTDPLLFDWEALSELSLQNAEPELRIIRAEGECRAKVEQYHSLPLEVAQLGSKTPQEFDDLMRRAGLDPEGASAVSVATGRGDSA